jgi:hypothetical protein
MPSRNAARTAIAGCRMKRKVIGPPGRAKMSLHILSRSKKETPYQTAPRISRPTISAAARRGLATRDCGAFVVLRIMLNHDFISFLDQRTPRVNLTQISKDRGEHRLQLPLRAILRGHDIVVAADRQFDRQLAPNLMIQPATAPTGTVHFPPAWVSSSVIAERSNTLTGPPPRTRSRARKLTPPT